MRNRLWLLGLFSSVATWAACSSSTGPSAPTPWQGTWYVTLSVLDASGTDSGPTIPNPDTIIITETANGPVVAASAVTWIAAKSGVDTVATFDSVGSSAFAGDSIQLSVFGQRRGSAQGVLCALLFK